MGEEPDKTAELREVFKEVTDADTVTETQTETRGSIADRGEPTERLAELIATMRDRYGFSTDLPDEAYRRVARGFYDDESDGDVAADLDVSRGVVYRARLDLHLVREADTDAPFDLDAFREALQEDPATADLADAFDVGESTARRYRRAVTARQESRQANDRYRDEFDEILGEADLSGRLTEDAQQDGLDDATDGMETDVSF